MLFWLCLVMCGVAASCTIAAHPTATCSASDSKDDSSETHAEVVESCKWFVVIIVFIWSLLILYMNEFFVCAVPSVTEVI